MNITKEEWGEAYANFQKTFHDTPYSYIIAKRIERGKQININEELIMNCVNCGSTLKGMRKCEYCGSEY